MKKILTVILTISVLLTLSINCFATSAEYTLDFSQYEQYKDELAEIVALVEKRPQDFDYFTDMEIEKLDDFFTENTLVYPSFFCDAEITAATADDFASIIPDKHLWNVKTGKNRTVFRQRYDKWIKGSTEIDPNYIDEKFIDLTTNGLKKLFEQRTGIEKFDDAKLIMLEADGSRTNCAYGRAGQNEYIMGLYDRGLFAKDTVCTAEQAVYICLAERKVAIDKAKEYSGTGVIATDDGNYTSPEDFDFSKIDLNELKTGNITFELKEEKPQNNTVWVILALVFTAALVAAAVVLGFKKKKA